MQYLGSKARIAKHLLPIMLTSRGDRVWVEPFVGGANMITKVSGQRIGGDNHPYLIALLIALQNGYTPPTEVSTATYYKIKLSPQNYPPELVGFVGFLCSFGGKWWGGYAFNAKGENYAARGSRVLIQQAQTLQGVSFYRTNYTDLVFPSSSLIYCDPPYEGTTRYTTAFNHLMFWEWCRQKTREGHLVFISEYTSPKDFECVLEIKHKTILDRNSQYPRLERLFRYAPGVSK